MRPLAPRQTPVDLASSRADALPQGRGPLRAPGSERAASARHQQAMGFADSLRDAQEQRPHANVRAERESRSPGAAPHEKPRPRRSAASEAAHCEGRERPKPECKDDDAETVSANPPAERPDAANAQPSVDDSAEESTAPEQADGASDAGASISTSGDAQAAAGAAKQAIELLPPGALAPQSTASVPASDDLTAPQVASASDVEQVGGLSANIDLEAPVASPAAPHESDDEQPRNSKAKGETAQETRAREVHADRGVRPVANAQRSTDSPTVSGAISESASTANISEPAARDRGAGHGISMTGSADRSASPATARAEHVQLGIRLDNATGQSAGTADMPAQPAAPATAMVGRIEPGNGLGRALAGATAGDLRAQRADDAAPSAFTSQAIRGLTAMLNQRGGAMTMRLDPPELGALRVQMTITAGVVSADFQASTAAGHALLDRHMAALRTSLESQGLTVDRLTVQSPPPGGSSQQHHAAGERDGGGNSQGGSSWGAQHDAGGAESRGRQQHQQHLPQRHDFDESRFAGELTFDALLTHDADSIAAPDVDRTARSRSLAARSAWRARADSLIGVS